MTRLLIAFFTLVTFPASAQEFTGSMRFVPVLNEASGVLWVIDTTTGEVRSCIAAGDGRTAICSLKE